MSKELVENLLKYNVSLPRYTSYPTAPEWDALDETLYREKLESLGNSGRPIALYFHIPFCKTMCLFCACSVVLNRKEENEVRYIDYLIREIQLVASFLKKRCKVSQLHFGGGTPTKISIALFEKLYRAIEAHFDLLPDAEIAIEIDPRTVFEDKAEKLLFLKKLGFCRVSFGVQDTDPKVQEAVKRRQSYEVTRYTFDKAKEFGFSGINVDLIYGLPYQTETSFKDTVEKIIDMGPDRIALFSYAKVPWLKAHQKAIRDDSLPTTIEKFQIYVQAKGAFQNAGYKAIGMDHFAKKTDELAKAYEEKTLQRNFQGYTVLPVDDLIGFGVTSIGFLEKTYVQNVKELSEYYEKIDARSLACCRGKVLSSEDMVIRYVIQKLMCDFALDKVQFSSLFHCSFDDYFSFAKEKVEKFEQEGFLIDDASRLFVTKKGELFIRNIASIFDVYLQKKEGHKRFSRAI